jgi:hypothetical protein
VCCIDQLNPQPNADTRQSSEVGGKVGDAALKSRTPEHPARESSGDGDEEMRI